MNQMIDTLDLEDSKRYMHHYNFPPSPTETGAWARRAAGRSGTARSPSGP